MPLASIGTQSNTDAQPVPTKNQAEMYCCKYCSKHLKNSGARSALFDVLDDMEQKDKAGKDKYGDTMRRESSVASYTALSCRRSERRCARRK